MLPKFRTEHKSEKLFGFPGAETVILLYEIEKKLSGYKIWNLFYEKRLLEYDPWKLLNNDVESIKLLKFITVQIN